MAWPPEDNWVEMEDCEIIAATDRAILLEHETDQFWVPKSCVQNGDEYEAGDAGCLVLVKEWFARKERLI